MKRKEKIKYQEIVDNFCAADSLKDIAKLLDIKAKDLSYILYYLNGGREYQYVSYEMKKKGGGLRTINAPAPALKKVQKSLNRLLKKIYWEKPCVHSFLYKKSIVTNANRHVNKRFVFNIDLEEFFPSINFGRVRGLFMARPYTLSPKAATVIAQIACFKNELPQGSPCSPIISNMICSKMDNQLQHLAKNTRCFYTRYADDITFSTNMPEFPEEIAINSGKSLLVGNELDKIIQANYFRINQKKVRIQTRDMRQEVTGIIVNEFANPRRKLIRQVRAMLNAWEKYGLENAQQEYLEKYCTNSSGLNESNDNDEIINKDFKQVVEGKISFISMVRNEKRNKERINIYYKRIHHTKDDISKRLYEKFYEQILRDGQLPIVRTEGHTDWMHLSAAWQTISKKSKFEGVEFDFFNVKKDVCFGNNNLIKFAENSKKLKPFNKKVICVFDSDDNGINKKHKNLEFREWDNNVYSFVVPNPKKYQDKPISIEFFYPEKLIKTKDENGRRLFFSDEFNEDGSHKKMVSVKYGYIVIKGGNVTIKKKHMDGVKKIIDSNVYLKKGNSYFNIALSKSKFAYNILKKEKNFENPDFSEFRKIFELIKKIIEK